jgi:hypothetical protein
MGDDALLVHSRDGGALDIYLDAVLMLTCVSADDDGWVCIPQAGCGFKNNRGRS